MKHKTICVNKKPTYIVLFILFLALLAFVNYRFLQTKTSYQSKAATPIRKTNTNTTSYRRQAANPNFLSADPNKIIQFWIDKKNSSNRKLGNTYIKSLLESDSGYKLIPGISNLSYVGELDTVGPDKGIPTISGIGCTEGGSGIYEPFGLILRVLYKSGTSYNSIFGSKYSSISILKDNATGDFSLLVTAWSAEASQTTPKVVAMRYFPPLSIINAFTAMLYELKEPMVNDYDISNSSVTACFNSTYNRWEKWVNYLVNDKDAMPVTANSVAAPTQNPLQPRSPYQYQLSTKIQEFMKKFTSIYKAKFPEVVLYPYIKKGECDKLKMACMPEKMSTLNIPGNRQIGTGFNNIVDSQLKDFQLPHITYYFDKCGLNDLGSFYRLKTHNEPLWEEYIEHDGTNQKKIDDTSTTGLKKALINGALNVIDKKAFFDFPETHTPYTSVYNDTHPLPECNADLYGLGVNSCPTLSRQTIQFKENNSQFGSDNAFFLTLKPITDSSCDYPQYKNGSVTHNAVPLQPITVVIYLGP